MLALVDNQTDTVHQMSECKTEGEEACVQTSENQLVMEADFVFATHKKYLTSNGGCAHFHMCNCLSQLPDLDIVCSMLPQVYQGCQLLIIT